MQDLDRAILIGQLSYGKGLVQIQRRRLQFKGQIYYGQYYILLDAASRVSSMRMESGFTSGQPEVNLQDQKTVAQSMTAVECNRISKSKETEYPEIVQKNSWTAAGYLTTLPVIALHIQKNTTPDPPQVNDFWWFCNYLKKECFEDSSALEKKLNLFCRKLGRQKRQDFNQDIERLKTSSIRINGRRVLTGS